MKKINKNDIEDILPLTPLQEGMLFHYLKEPGSGQYFEQLSLEVMGDIHVPLFEKAWNLVIQTNQMLRTVFRWEKMDKPTQLILKNHHCTPTLYDLSTEDTGLQKSRCEAIKDKDRHEPFDLHEVPFRVLLCKLAKNRSLMVISNHHIIYDGWSNGVILKEFFRVYEDLGRGQNSILPVKPLFKEFIKWSQNQDKAKQAIFWREYLAGFETKTELPVSRQQAAESKHFLRHSFVFEREIGAKLDAFVKSHRITLASVFYSAWGILLQKYTNNEDVVFGSTLAGRPARIKGIENMVGLCINTVPLRVQAHPVEKVRTLVLRVDKSVQSREEFGNTPLLDIMAYGGLGGNQSPFDTLMTIENYPLDNRLVPEGSSLSVISYSMEEMTHYDVTVSIVPFENTEVNVVYNPILFEQSTIENMASHFKEIVNQVLENPEEEVSRLEIVTAEEKHRILYEFNHTATPYPQDKTLHQLYEEQVERAPDHMALIGETASPRATVGASPRGCPDLAPCPCQLTYAALNEKANGLARLLKTKGAGANSIIGLMPGRAIEMMIGLLGILKTGGCYVPIGPEFPVERRKTILAQCGIKIVLTTGHPQPVTDGAEHIDIGDVLNSTGETTHLLHIGGPTDLMYIIYTSGSTGVPKGVMIEHRAFVNFIKGMTDIIPFTPKSRILSLTTVSFDIFGLETILPLTQGSTVVIGSSEEQLSPRAIAAVMQKEKITLFQATPSRLQLILADVESAPCLQGLNSLLIGGEALPAELLKRTRKITAGKVNIYNVYGPTETTVWSTVKAVSGQESLNIGRPIANTRVYILNRWGLVQPLGVAGELSIAGLGLARGYFDNEPLTHEKFVANPYEPGEKMYKTGDLGQWLPDGNIQCLGRVDHQVKIRGFRIELGEIENFLQNYPPIAEAVVTVKEMGEDKYLCAYVVMENALESILPALKEHLAKHLPDYMIPAHLMQIQSIPLTINGKVDRKALPDPELIAKNQYIAPRNELEETLVTLWAEILGRKKELIGCGDNFFRLGGHSLKAIGLVAKIHKKFNVQVPLTEVFKRNTIESLAQYIAQTNRSEYQHIEPVAHREYYEPSFGQKRVWVLSRQSEESSLSFNMPGRYPLQEALHLDALNQALASLIERHESLRTIFPLIGDDPKQKILPPHQVHLTFVHSDIRGLGDKEKILRELAESERNTPFDLLNGPLLRAKVVQMETTEVVLFFTMHHIISDFVSMEVLKKEFFQLYRCFKAGQENPLKPLRIHYKDFANWQLKQWTDHQLDSLGQYWLNRFNNKIPLLQLPYDKERPKVMSNNGERVEFSISANITRQLRAIALANNVTLFMLLYASVNAHLFFYSGQEDMIMGIPSSGREHPDLENQIGFYINTLVLRTQLKEEETLLDLLEKVKKVTLDAYAHQMYPFDLLIQQLKLKREPGRHPLFDVMVDMLNLNLPQNLWEPPTNEPVETDNGKDAIIIHEGRSKFDLTFYFYEEEKTIHVAFEYNTDLFLRQTIMQMAKRYLRLLEQIVQNPAGSIFQLLLNDEVVTLALGSSTQRPSYEKDASYHQERLWFIDRFEAGDLYESSPIYHNIPLIFRITGEVEGTLLEKSIGAVINRHETLRSRIKTKDSKTVQTVEAEAVFKLEYLDLTAYAVADSGHDSGPNLSKNKEAYALSAAIDFAKQPFILEAESLIRAKLIQLSLHEFILVLGIHHIIADRHSLTIITQELFSFYSAGQKGQAPDLPELTVSYADFTQWQYELPHEIMETELFYWKRQLKGKLQALELPTDTPRARVHIFHEAHRHFKVDSGLLAKMASFCQPQGLSPFLVTMATFTALLSRYCGQEEILMGISDPNRNTPGLEHIVGPIANLLVIRSFVEENTPFLTLLERLHNTVRDAKKYKDIPFEKLDHEIKPAKDMSRTVFFDVLFQYEIMDNDVFWAGNLEIKNWETNIGYGKYDLNLLLQESGGAISGYLVYNGDYYHPATIERFSNHYLNLLENAITHPTQPIATLNVLTEKEKNQLLFEFNGMEAGFPQDKTIHQLFTQQVERTPDYIALLGESLGSLGGNISLTYKKLHAQSDRMAHELKEKGVVPDTIVAINIERSLEMIIGLLGILKAGGAYLPIDPDYPADRIQYMLKDSNVRLQLLGIDNRLECVEVSDASPPFFQGPASPACVPGNLAYIIYTSGTSGRPKGALIEHRNVVRLMFNEKFQFDFNNRDIWTLFHSFCFDFSVWEMYGSLLYGGKLVVIPKMSARNTEYFLELLKKIQVTILNQTPSAFYNLVDLELNSPGSELRIRYVIFGGEALTPFRLQAWHARYPRTRLINMYGITETTVHVTFKEIRENDIQLPTSNIGKPIPTLSAYVLDKHQKLQPMGVPGELHVGGEGVGRGYLNRPELTAEKFVENPYIPGERLYKSGDLVKRLPSGDLVYLGRIDLQVKIRGFRIELGEIESQILQHPAVKQVVVVDREDKERGKYLCAYFIAEPKLPAQELRELIAKGLPDYMIPAFFVQVLEIPLNSNGKVDRRELPEPGDDMSTGVEYIAPHTDIEKLITEIWTDVLKLKNLGVNDNFFDLGGSSFNILRVNRLLREKTKRDIPVVRMFEYPTIQALANHLEQEKTDWEETKDKDSMKQFDDLQDDSLNMMNQTMSILTGGNDDQSF